MHADVTNFISLVELSQTNFTNNYCVNRQVGANVRDNFVHDLKIILLETLVEILEYYLRDTTSDDAVTYEPGESFTGTATAIFAGAGTVTVDDNFFTVEEAQEVIDHINEIMESTHYLKLTDYF